MGGFWKRGERRSDLPLLLLSKLSSFLQELFWYGCLRPRCRTSTYRAMLLAVLQSRMQDNRSHVSFSLALCDVLEVFQKCGKMQPSFFFPLHQSSVERLKIKFLELFLQSSEATLTNE